MADATRSTPRPAHLGAVAFSDSRQDDDDVSWHGGLPPPPAHLDADDVEGYLAYLDSLPPEEDVSWPVKKSHAEATSYGHTALANRFPDAEVATELMVYFRGPGRPLTELPEKAAPDVMVALRVPRRKTRSRYDANVLGPPDFLLEVLSRGSWRNDVGYKLDLYERMGVREYLLFDPTSERFAGQDLFGYALNGRRNERRPLGKTTLTNGRVGVVCELLDLCAYVQGTDEVPEPGQKRALILRWHDPATGKDIPNFDESKAQAAAAELRAERAEAQAAAERVKRQELERRIRQLLAQRSPDSPA